MTSTRRVLDIGQCNPDHYAISRLVEETTGASVDRAHGLTDALELLERQSYALVLVNRVLDRDGASGMAVISALKSQDRTSKVPVMLVSNYDSAQEEAVAMGAVRGFGKNELDLEQTATRLRAALG